MSSVIAAITPVVIAAFGGGFAVFGAYDDSPGGTLLGAATVLEIVVDVVFWVVVAAYLDAFELRRATTVLYMGLAVGGAVDEVELDRQRAAGGQGRLRAPPDPARRLLDPLVRLLQDVDGGAHARLYGNVYEEERRGKSRNPRGR